MKKLSLLILSCSIASAAFAQFSKHSGVVTPPSRRTVNTFVPLQNAPAKHTAAKTTAATFYTQTFAGGLPGTWSTGVISGPGTWHYTTVASTSAYHLAALASTTAANGWMIFDSDSLGSIGGATPAGYLQSEVINCSAHPSVRLNFQELYRSFYDSCFIWVSTSPTFASHTTYPVYANNNLSTNTSTTNPQTVHINISSAAASQATVYIRFVYYGDAGGSYSWNVDDISLSELDPHDAGISGSFLFGPQATAFSTSIFSTPLAFVDSVFPVTLLTNYGSNAETNVSVTAQIFNGASSVYSQSYTAAFGVTVGSDADLTNNIDSVKFSVTDTTWMVNSGLITGGLYVHRASPALSYMQGARFDVPTGAVGDTISGFGVAFSSSSAPTGAGTVSVQLFSATQSGGTNTGWTYEATSIAKSLTTADYSTSTSTVWADFRSDPVASGGWGQLVVTADKTYAAVIQINGVTSDLVVLETTAPNATGYCGYFGQEDTTQNTGGTSDFGFGGSIATGNPSSVPMVRLYFGPHSTVGINDVSVAGIATSAYPNPAGNELSVSFNLAVSADVTVSLVNTLGQVVATQTVSNTSKGSAAFNTSKLANGVYSYTVMANGGRSTGRVVVAH